MGDGQGETRSTSPMSPNWALIIFCALMGFAIGCGQAQFRHGGDYTAGELGSVFLLTLAIFAWTREDAWRRSYRRSIGFNISLIGLTIFALPYYLFKTRGLGRGLIAVALIFAVYLLVAVSMVLGVIFVRFLKI